MALQQLNINNRRAYFEYEVLEKFTAGIMLLGTEIKSIKDGKANMNEAYCVFIKGELFLKNMHITEYKLGTIYNHEPLRMRKLLLKGRELAKMEAKVKEKGLTIIPLKMFLSERGFAKMDIALAKGKKVHDKRESIKNKDNKRDLARVMKDRR